MATTALMATRPGQGGRRRPKTYGGNRRCHSDMCDTRLSRYNNSEFCFRHAPVKYPRLRGVFTEEYEASRA
ncbi:MAG: hypothetical protein KJP12_03540 [Acidimicrobiia bacterium]|nr:hypothetical protein [Acidimicrobiia bacterium]NNF68820.1 hypothetical protein [Acidimicrobiia bacterium]NNK90856.1 hypothetical protein [Acidimicrobiia bacterium]